jgi:UDP-4-amino-4,6-dideoxy-N-acetyl-beta-L-altrosamine N-acetyltransferase
MKLDKTAVYEVDGFVYKNYLLLSQEEQLQVLNLRNREYVRKWMYSKEEISVEDHFKFIKSLNGRNDRCYWAIFKNGQIVASFNINDINYYDSSCQTGAFYSDISLKGLETVFKVGKASYKLLFEIIGLKKVEAYTHKSNKFILACNDVTGLIIDWNSNDDFLYQYIDIESYNKNISSTFKDALARLKTINSKLK